MSETEGDLLMVVEVSESIGLNASTLNRYLAEESIRSFMGATGKPARYPRASLPKFERLRDMHKAGEIKPKTPSLLFREFETSGAASHNEKRDSIAETVSEVDPALLALLERMIAVHEMNEARALPAPETQEAPPKPKSEVPGPNVLLLSTVEAAALLGVSAKTFRRHVAPRLTPRRMGSLVRWARVDVERYAAEG